MEHYYQRNGARVEQGLKDPAHCKGCTLMVPAVSRWNVQPQGDSTVSIQENSQPGPENYLAVSFLGIHTLNGQVGSCSQVEVNISFYLEIEILLDARVFH